MEVTEGPIRFRCGEWAVNETDVYTYGRGARKHSIGFSVQHEPTNTRLVWGMKHLPDAKNVARWCHEVCPSPTIERGEDTCEIRDPGDAEALRSIVAAVDHARHMRIRISEQRKRMPLHGECGHSAGYVCDRCKFK